MAGKRKTDDEIAFLRVCLELSPTHCPRADVDVSLKDFPPASSEAVLPLLPFPGGMEKKFPEKQKSSQIFIV